MKRFFAADNLLNWLLVFVPIAMVMEWVLHSPPLWIFVISCLAIIPLAGQMGHATEEISEHVGEGLGGLLNATFGNEAEHSTAIIMAAKNKMDAAINIAVGSSIQVALFVAPLLVFLSYVLAPAGRGPMDLIFTQMEVLAIVACAGIMAFCANDGESHWMEGVQLLAIYVIFGIAFYFLPVVSTATGVPAAAGH